MSERVPTPPEFSWKAHGFAIAALVAATMVSAAVLPSVVPGLDRSSDASEDQAPDDQAAVTKPTDVTDVTNVTDFTDTDVTGGVGSDVTETTIASIEPPTSGVATAGPETVPTNEPADVTTSASTTEPAREASLGPVPSTNDTAPQVVSIQTVPVVRDLIVEIDGQRVSTDARGAIDFTPENFDAQIEVIGLTAVPPLSEVEFLQWSDGNTDQIRSAADMPGPVIQLGLRVSKRVIVELDGSAPPATIITFVSDQVGQFAVPVGEPTFLVSEQARLIDGVLIAETIEYTVDASQGDYARGTFRARPESLWTITGS